MPKNILGTSCTRPQNDDVCLLLAAGSTPIFLLFSIIFFYIYFRVGFSFCSAANRQKASPSFGYKLWQLAKTYLWHNKIFACAIKNKFVCVCARESDSAASQCCAVFGVRMRLRMAQVIRHKIEIFSPPAKCEK